MGKRGPQPIYPKSVPKCWRIWVSNIARMPKEKQAEWVNLAIQEKAERDKSL